MDIRSTEARTIEKAFIDGRMIVRQVMSLDKPEDAAPGSVLVNTATNQIFGYTNRDRIYRLDAQHNQMNLLADDRCSFDPVAFLPHGEEVSTSRALSRRELLPARSNIMRLGDSLATPVSITVVCTIASIFVGHGVHYFVPGLLSYAVGHWPFHRAPDNAAAQPLSSPNLLQRLHPHPQYMSLHGEYAEDNAEQVNRAFADMGANEMDGGVGWSYAEAAHDLSVQLPEATPLNIGIAGGVSLGAVYGIRQAHKGGAPSLEDRPRA